MEDEAPVQNSGREFEDADVAGAYRHRAPYPLALHRRLSDLAPRRDRALDLGCGTGKLAGGLAHDFGEVVAVDLSEPMLQAGRSLNRQSNIQWIAAPAEEAPLAGAFDLAVAGASLHWMRHAALFPRLVGLLAPDGVFAAIEGDGPAEAPWLGAYRAVIGDWVARLGHTFNDPAFVARMRAHEAWMDIAGRETFEAECRMSLTDLIDGEHSRATWTRAKMGPDRAHAFDEDLREALTPHADGGVLAFTTRTSLVWGRPRRSLREADSGNPA
jgi:SAM-dependent methyltransferase